MPQVPETGGVAGAVRIGEEGPGGTCSTCVPARETDGCAWPPHQGNRPPNQKKTTASTIGNSHQTTRHNRLARSPIVDGDRLRVALVASGALLDGGIRETGHEPPDRVLRVEPDVLGVGTHERPDENAAGQPRDVVALERFERGHRESWSPPPHHAA